MNDQIKSQPAIQFEIICITHTNTHCTHWNKNKNSDSDIHKMTPLWMQIVVLSIDRSAAAFLPSISFIFWCYLPPSCSYQFISPHISPSSLLFSQIYLSKSCVCVCVCPCTICARKHIYLVNGQRKVCLLYKLLLRDREMTSSDSERVCVSICFFVCLHRYFFAFLWIR